MSTVNTANGETAENPIAKVKPGGVSSRRNAQ
jgi:hypothetical protein